MPDDKFLDVIDLDAGYGRSQVLFGVTMQAPRRGGIAILGRNGAGKTTLMKAIVGELPLRRGTVSFDARMDAVPAGLIALVITSTLLYAMAAITVAARIFGAEEVLYSEQSSWKDFLSRSRKPQSTASLSNAFVCLAMMVPINFVLRGVLMTSGTRNTSG